MRRAGRLVAVDVPASVRVEAHLAAQTLLSFTISKSKKCLGQWAFNIYDSWVSGSLSQQPANRPFLPSNCCNYINLSIVANISNVPNISIFTHFSSRMKKSHLWQEATHNAWTDSEISNLGHYDYRQILITAMAVPFFTCSKIMS